MTDRKTWNDALRDKWWDKMGQKGKVELVILLTETLSDWLAVNYCKLAVQGLLITFTVEKRLWSWGLLVPCFSPTAGLAFTQTLLESNSSAAKEEEQHLLRILLKTFSSFQRHNVSLLSFQSHYMAYSCMIEPHRLFTIHWSLFHYAKHVGWMVFTVFNTGKSSDVYSFWNH